MANVEKCILYLQMALEWVQGNIVKFGGDPTRVTLVGVNAGAALTSQLMFLRQARGLFSRVMSMGGSGHAPWAKDMKPMETTKSLAAKVGCPVDDPSKMMNCLLEKDANELVQMEDLETAVRYHGYTSPLASYPWRPVVSEELNWSNPLQPPEIVFIGGATTSEGRQMSYQVSGRPSGSYNDPDKFLEFLEMFVLHDLQAPRSAYEAIKAQYFAVEVLADAGKLQKAAIEMWTDWAYLTPLSATLGNVTK